jgi:hypothetical protein
MPVYVYNCRGCGVRFERYLPMALCSSLVLHDCAGVGQKVFLPPMVRGDLPGYQSPIDGRWIEGRKARLEDLRRNNCRPYEEGEKEYNARRLKQENDAFDAKIDQTVEREFEALSVRKKELLEQEIRAGADVQVVRQAP